MKVHEDSRQYTRLVNFCHSDYTPTVMHSVVVIFIGHELSLGFTLPQLFIAFLGITDDSFNLSQPRIRQVSFIPIVAAIYLFNITKSQNTHRATPVCPVIFREAGTKVVRVSHFERVERFEIFRALYVSDISRPARYIFFLLL